MLDFEPPVDRTQQRILREAQKKRELQLLINRVVTIVLVVAALLGTGVFALYSIRWAVYGVTRNPTVEELDAMITVEDLKRYEFRDETLAKVSPVNGETILARDRPDDSIALEYYYWEPFLPDPRIVDFLQNFSEEDYDKLKETYGSGFLPVEKKYGGYEGIKEEIDKLQLYNGVQHFWSSVHLYGSDEQAQDAFQEVVDEMKHKVRVHASGEFEEEKDLDKLQVGNLTYDEHQTYRAKLDSIGVQAGVTGIVDGREVYTVGYIMTGRFWYDKAPCWSLIEPKQTWARVLPRPEAPESSETIEEEVVEEETSEEPFEQETDSVDENPPENAIVARPVDSDPEEPEPESMPDPEPAKIENLDCTVFIETKVSRELLLESIAKIVRGELKRTTINTDWGKLELEFNERFYEEDKPEGFDAYKYYPHQLTIEPGKDVDQDAYIESVGYLINQLNNTDAKTGVECDFLDRL